MDVLTYKYFAIDSIGYTHSIDMIYFEYYSRFSLDYVMNEIHKLRDKYPLLVYEEYLDRPRNSKYDFYLDGIRFGNAFINLGKYCNYDKVSKSFDIFNMFQIRINPNKAYLEPWYEDLRELCRNCSIDSNLRKYDYAIDIPRLGSDIKVFYSHKEFGLYKGTRYYGQSGRHNYTKIYDKAKEVKTKDFDIGVMTRIEYTLFSNEIPKFENVYIKSSDLSSLDENSLNDTDKAIIDMFHNLRAMGIEYDLKLGRKKMDKLNPYLYGEFQLLEYGNFLNDLLEKVIADWSTKDIQEHQEYKMYSGSVPDDDGFLVVDDSDLPFD